MGVSQWKFFGYKTSIIENSHYKSSIVDYTHSEGKHRVSKGTLPNYHYREKGPRTIKLLNHFIVKGSVRSQLLFQNP